MFDFLKNLNIDEGIEEFKATENAVLVDVRSKDEFQKGHIPKSINLDIADMNLVASLVPSKQTPLFVYCRSGLRSHVVAEELKRQGYVTTKNIGGIKSYTGPLEKRD